MKARTMNFYIGTSGFSYSKWKGRFYPAKIAREEMLSFYSARFRAVEINSSFRKMPAASVLEAWARQVPDAFRFAFKAPQRVTHIKRLKGVGKLVSSMLDDAGKLKKRLGPILFQLPPNFKKDVPRLSKFLAVMQQRCRAAMEFRHQSWFDDEVFALLRKHGTALCIADAEGDLKVPFVATADWGYLRLRRDDYSTAALKKWSARVKVQAWRDCFVFFKHEDTGKGPTMAARLLELLAA